MTTPSPSRPYSPPWPYCEHRADSATDGCRGIQVPGHSACLAHISESERTTYLANLTPGADVDYRGTPFTSTLIHALLQALVATDTQKPHFGNASFDQATFSGTANFGGATFSGTANFGSAKFSGTAEFRGVTFSGTAEFRAAIFSSTAWFAEATFSDTAWFEWAMFSEKALFDQVTFSSAAWFDEATFSSIAWFGRATFSSIARFIGASFSGTAGFEGATFASTAEFDAATFAGDAGFCQARFPTLLVFGLVCGNAVDLSGAVFEAPVTLEIAAAGLRCERTRWAATATLRLRYAVVDLSDAVLSAPVAVTAYPTPFTRSLGSEEIDEQHLKAIDESVKLTSVRGVDAAHLVLTDINLSRCVFTGAFHLDQLRLAGRCTFALTPSGVHWWRDLWPYRWSRRRMLAEERHWRALPTDNPAPPRGWPTNPHHRDRTFTPAPEDVAATYRHLRKAFEDGKDQPGGADFYYGEMEMRRHACDAPATERALLWAYWLISGYGLRAMRAITALILVIAAATIIFATIGFACSSTPAYQPTPPPPGMAGTAPTYRQIDIPGTKPGWGTALYHAIDSSTALLHTPGTEALTATGRATEIALRLLGPVLLGLAALAVRGRLKR